MTREESIQYLTDTGISPEHIMELVEAFEQETAPFDFELYQAGLMDMPKGMIEVLDKIETEIMKLQTYKMFEGEDTVYVKCEDVLQIIDKYRKEQP